MINNDVLCKTVGIDNIRMRMYDRHVLDLKKNLLPLEDLEACGYKFLGADGGIKVIKYSMMILKGKRITNLYKLPGSIILVMLQQ